MLVMLTTFVTGLETRSGGRLWNGEARRALMQLRMRTGP